MDNNLPLDDDEIERRLLIKAVEQARRDPRPSIPHEVVQAKMEKKSLNYRHGSRLFLLMKIEWRQEAEDDLNASFDYMQERNPRAAIELWNRMKRASRSLGNFHIAAALVARQIRGTFGTTICFSL